MEVEIQSDTYTNTYLNFVPPSLKQRSQILSWCQLAKLFELSAERACWHELIWSSSFTNREWTWVLMGTGFMQNKLY